MATAASVDERDWGEDGVVCAKIQTFSTLHFPTAPCRVLWKWAKDWRKILLLNYADNNVSDEEFVPLYDCYRSKNRFQSYVVFYLENMNSADCQTEFRVQKADPPRLPDALHISAVFHCKLRSICNGLKGLCVLLRRRRYPNRFSDMIQRFARPVSVLSLITNAVMDFKYLWQPLSPRNRVE